MKGRPPTPTALKILNGNPGKRPLNALEPSPALGVGECPEHFTGPLRKLWDRLAARLTTLGVLAETDAMALELLCSAFHEWRTATAAVDELGTTYESDTANGRIVRPRPEVAHAADAMRRVKTLLSEFGLTPSSRTKIKALPDDEIDEFDKFVV